jgi:hypothetical protein
MDLVKIGWGGMEWIRLAQDRSMWTGLLNAEMNFLVP